MNKVPLLADLLFDKIVLQTESHSLQLVRIEAGGDKFLVLGMGDLVTRGTLTLTVNAVSFSPVSQPKIKHLWHLTDDVKSTLKFTNNVLAAWSYGREYNEK